MARPGRDQPFVPLDASGPGDALGPSWPGQPWPRPFPNAPAPIAVASNEPSDRCVPWTTTTMSFLMSDRVPFATPATWIVVPDPTWTVTDVPSGRVTVI